MTWPRRSKPFTKTVPVKKTKKAARRSTRKPAKSVLITAKAGDAQLKRALSRAKTRKKHTELMDHSVPETLLFQGVISTSNHRQSPEVEYRKEHETSPFILSLRSELVAPKALIEEAQFEPIRLNLLQGHNHSMVPLVKKTSLENAFEVGNLSLSHEDIAEQLAEEVLATHGWSRLSLPINSSEPTLSIKRVEQPIAEGAFAEHSFMPIISSETFAPSQVPEDIFAYFDFPEEEAIYQLNELEEDLEELLLIDEEVEEIFEDHEEELASSGFTWPSIKLPSLQMPAFMLGNGSFRAVASFLVLSFIFVLPLHAMNVMQELRQTQSDLESAGTQGAELLTIAAQSAAQRDGAGASDAFASAGQSFDEAKETVGELGAITSLILSSLPATKESFQTGTSLITAGEELAIAGERIADGYRAIEMELSPTPISRLDLLNAYLTSALPHLHKASVALTNVTPEVLSDKQAQQLDTLSSALPALIETVEEFQELYALAAPLLGADGTKRYLVVFQNNTEIRPTGGFIGSFAEIKMHDGVIEHMQIPGGGSYDLQGTLQNNLIAPEPLQLLKARWEFQDGNWFPDFPTSARQLMQFYQDAGGPSVDGVLAINATFVADLLAILGPITMDEYGRTIDQENFIFEAQKIVELEYDKEENRPKAFIGDLAPKLVERAIEKTSQDFLSVVDYLNTGLSQKHVQLYLDNEVLQREIIARGWGGEMKWTEGDYLMVVDTNLGGGKTDGVIKQNVDVQVDIAEDGSIINTVTIDRTHYGIRGLLFTGVNNVDYLRVYVPKGSELLSAEGFEKPDDYLFDKPEDDWVLDDDLTYAAQTHSSDPLSHTDITEEHGKTVFGNWVQTQPGTTSTIQFSYRLPITIDALEPQEGFVAAMKSWLGLPQTDQYTLLVQKQPGVLDRTTNVTVHVPDTLSTLWSSHDTAGTTIDNDSDALLATLFESL
jgi:hypothetical protein